MKNYINDLINESGLKITPKENSAAYTHGYIKCTPYTQTIHEQVCRGYQNRKLATTRRKNVTLNSRE